MTGTMNSRPRISSTMSLMGVAKKIKKLKIKKIIFFLEIKIIIFLYKNKGKISK
jgi:hypothetical protein